MKTQERVAEILARRTAALAERGAAEMRQRQRPFLVAALGPSLFAFALPEVASVIPFAGCARMPMRDPAVIGVVGQAGRFHSVIDLRRWLALPQEADAPTPAHLLLLRGAAPHLALAVDRVLGQFALSGEDAALELDGRLVALFDVSAMRGRLGLPAGENRL